MSAYAAQFLTAPLLTPTLNYDAELTLADITPDLFTWITRLAPFGQQNSEPIFLTRNATLAAPIRLIQEKHISLQLTEAPAASQQPKTISALGWSRGATRPHLLARPLRPPRPHPGLRHRHPLPPPPEHRPLRHRRRPRA